MALRIQRLSAAPSRSAEDYEADLRSLARRAQVAVGQSRPADVADCFSAVAGWEDEHRRLQGDLMLCDVLAGLQAKAPKGWAPLYHEAAVAMVAALRADALQPARWNLLGVACYELGQTKAAERCFAAVKRLQADHPHLADNMRAVRARKRRSVQMPFGPKFAARVKQTAQVAAKLADTVTAPDPAQQRLSLVMIVRDEEQMLGACLDSVKDVVDEMIIVDTGSEDGTRQIAEDFGATVIDFPWTGSFAEARNVSLEAATGDWVLHLDADERIVPEDAAKIRPLMARTYREGFTLVETNYTGDGSAQSAVTHAALRLWRHRPEYRFTGAIHEQKTEHMPTWLAERFEHTQIRMLHFGYLKDVIAARGKAQRNLQLLLDEAQTDPSAFNRFNIGTEYLQIGDAHQARAYLDEAWQMLTADAAGPRATGFGAMAAVRVVRARREASDLHGAADVLAQARGFYPDHTDLVYEQALIAQASGDHDEAVRLASEMQQMGDAPTQYAGVVGLGSYLAVLVAGESLEAAGRPGEALDRYRQGMAEHPDFDPFVSRCVRAALAAGADADTVAADVAQRTAADPVTVGLLVAHTFYEQQHVPQAEALYEQALTAAPSHPVARVGLVECALSRGDLDCVDQRTAGLDGADPSAPVLARAATFAALLRPATHLLTAARLLDSSAARTLGDADRDALRAWHDLLDRGHIANLDADAAACCVEMLSATLRLADAEASEQLIVLCKASQLALDERARLLGEVLFSCGYLESAAEEWLEWYDLEGPTADAIMGLARISLAQGRRDEALALARDAETLDPGHPVVVRMLAVLAG